MQLKRTTEYGMPGPYRQPIRAGQAGGHQLGPRPETRDQDGVHERGDGEHRHPLEQLEPRRLPRDQPDDRDDQRGAETQERAAAGAVDGAWRTPMPARPT